MERHFKPLLAAAFAAGLIPIVDRKVNDAQGALITVAGFDFEGYTSGSTAAFSLSYPADVSAGTVTLSRTGSSGAISSVPGNPGRALSGNNMYGGSYTFKFSLDNLQSLGISFDMIGNGPGPRDFQVLVSTDGTTFQSFTDFALILKTVTATASGGTNTATASIFASGSSASAWNFAFTAPTGFSDAATGVAGAMGYLQILQSGDVGIIGIEPNTGGTNRIDNVLITANLSTVPEPAAASIVTLASAALALRRRNQIR